VEGRREVVGPIWVNEYVRGDGMEMGATPALGAGAGADTQPYKEEFEKVKELAWEFQQWANQDPSPLDEGEDWTPKLQELCKEYGFVLVDEDFLVRHLGISMERAEHFLYWFRNWETNIEGSDGGFEILYSPRTNVFYAITGEWWGRTGEYYITVEKYTPQKLREIIGDP